MNDAGDIADLYSSRLRELARDAAHRGKPEHFDTNARGDNPMCGDRVDLYVTLEEPRIGEVRHVARGCEICQASATMLARLAPGRTREEAASLGRRAAEIARSGQADEAEPLSIFAVVHKFPSRVKCVTLPWKTLDAALAGEKETSSE
ncbi:Fe-S cluster assembly sulfur transfer protein SufU [Roseococcus sp. YIM B11640]|uniref:Fe-S cluster assembly sulfur transfer protein SufU n=1 Tax=Roseococcus sp. YIM B11640 TaxID=3133973 RepID=UPI003C7D55CA